MHKDPYAVIYFNVLFFFFYKLYSAYINVTMK